MTPSLWRVASWTSNNWPSTAVLQPGCLACSPAGCLHYLQTAAPLYVVPGSKTDGVGAATATNISLQKLRTLAILAALENLYLDWLSHKLCWTVDLVCGGHIGRMMPAVNSQRQATSGDTFTMKGCQLDQQQLTLHLCATTRLFGLWPGRMSPLSSKCGTTARDTFKQGSRTDHVGAFATTTISSQPFRTLEILAALESYYFVTYYVGIF